MLIRRHYAAATLELSQPDNEERKARALAAATKELEICFKKEDFRRMQVINHIFVMNIEMFEHQLVRLP